MGDYFAKCNPQTQSYSPILVYVAIVIHMQAGTDNLVNGIGFYLNTYTRTHTTVASDTVDPLYSGH